MADFTVLHEVGQPPVIVTQPCIQCGQSAEIILDDPRDALAMEQVRGGAFVQKAFWYWAPDQRELLISGTHAHCFAAIFADLDDEEDN